MADQKGPGPYPLSPLDHLSPRTHVPKLLYFSTADPDETIPILRDALTKTIAAFPLVAGSVGFLDGADQPGSLAVQAPYFSAEDILSVKDLRAEYDYESIRANGFPTDAVGAHALPDIMGKPAQVFLAQANLIRGGLVLVCGVHHCVMDETGIFNLIKLWSTFCHGGEGATLVGRDWIDRDVLMRGEGLGRLQDHPEYTLLPEIKPGPKPSGNPVYLSESSDVVDTAILFFSDASLKRLKALATADSATAVDKEDGRIASGTEGSGASDVSWVSTNDAMCALVWCCITSARMATGATGTTPTMFNMTVNGRSRLVPPMSSDFTGNVVMISKAASTFDRLVSSYPSALGDIALLIRKSVVEIDHVMIKDVVQMVRSVPDVRQLAPGGYSSHDRNLGCSSWSTQPYYSLNWGGALGGRCKRLRWRRLKSDGVLVVFPRIPAIEDEHLGPGGLEICLGLQREHMQYLRQDATFNQFVEWRAT